MPIERISSGIVELDRCLQNGFPSGYVINVRGEPGAGKTLFVTQVATKNAERGLKTVYVSFLEDREKFIAAASTLLPQVRKHVESDIISYVELSSVTQAGVSPLMELVLERVDSVEPSILVFDSYSAVVQALGSEAEGRALLNNLFSRIFSKRKVTTLIITEGDQNDFVSYVADGIIRMSRKSEPTSYRILEILKMRSVPLDESKFLFVFEKGRGLRVFRPFNATLSKKLKPRSAIQEKKKGYYSTGSRSLDAVIGGYQKGSLVLWEMGRDVPQLAFYSVVLLAAANFLVQERGVLIIPSLEFTRESLTPFVYPNKELFERNTRLFMDNVPQDSELFVQLTGDMERDLEKWNEVYEGFKKRGVPVLKVVSLDTLEHIYGKEKSVNLVRRAYLKTSHYKDVTLLLAKPGLEITEEVRYMAQTRLSLRFVDGYLLFKGLSPYTTDYLYEPRFSKGYPEVRLFEIN